MFGSLFTALGSVDDLEKESYVSDTIGTGVPSCFPFASHELLFTNPVHEFSIFRERETLSCFSCTYFDSAFHIIHQYSSGTMFYQSFEEFNALENTAQSYSKKNGFKDAPMPAPFASYRVKNSKKPQLLSSQSRQLPNTEYVNFSKYAIYISQERQQEEEIEYSKKPLSSNELAAIQQSLEQKKYPMSTDDIRELVFKLFNKKVLPEVIEHAMQQLLQEPTEKFKFVQYMASGETMYEAIAQNVTSVYDHVHTMAQSKKKRKKSRYKPAVPNSTDHPEWEKELLQNMYEHTPTTDVPVAQIPEVVISDRSGREAYSSYTSYTSEPLSDADDLMQTLFGSAPTYSQQSHAVSQPLMPLLDASSPNYVPASFTFDEELVHSAPVTQDTLYSGSDVDLLFAKPTNSDAEYLNENAPDEQDATMPDASDDAVPKPPTAPFDLDASLFERKRKLADAIKWMKQQYAHKT